MFNISSRNEVPQHPSLVFTHLQSHVSSLKSNLYQQTNNQDHFFTNSLTLGQSIVTGPKPDSFIFGVATASYQIEGAVNEDNRGPSVWDEFTHRNPSPIFDKSNGDVAADSYHNLDRDFALLEELGVRAYRFSISWSRILPNGDPNQVNQAGIDYYDRLINGLLQRNITPFVTMFHWDTPLALQTQFSGFMDRRIVNSFVTYACVLFNKYGDRVKHWITFNEPNEFCGNGYGGSSAAPGMNLSGVGDYLCMHHVILAHAKTYRMYQQMFKERQRGEIGITLNNRFVFGNNSDLVDRFMTFTLGWKMDPLFKKPFHGYPQEMKAQIEENSKAEMRSSSRLPEFTDEDREMFNESVVDFLGLNYYTSRIVSAGHYSPDSPASYDKDLNITLSVSSEWIRAKSQWLYSVPEGLTQLLMWIKEKYDNPKIYITENGWSDEGELRDIDRVRYLTKHLMAVQQALVNGVNVQGYFHWSLFDNFEWERGYR